MAVLAVALMCLLTLASCGDDPAPEIPAGPDGQPDPELVLGRDVWTRNCTACHGNDGAGGRGKKLNEGRVVRQYPDIEDQIEVLLEGKGNAMPNFSDRLTLEEINAVVRYTREVL